MADKGTPFQTAPAGDQLTVVGAATGGMSAAVAAAFAGLCCFGPSGIALLGVGGTLAAASLKPYRPLLLLVSLGLLAFAFRQAYGRRVMVDGASCPIRAGRLARVMLWTSAVIWVAKEARVTGKGGKVRTVFFTDRSLYWLSRYLDKATTSSQRCQLGCES